ncbi:MAG: hypothetical protein D3923_05945 [Candidatus Electrothrix sp. AR3]|nr:hypothetical protein [Candidatus Electrothrix sp. AR3]
MLQPNKNADPDLTIMAASTFILNRLKKNQFESYSDLHDALTKKDRKIASLLQLSLEFLFLLGLIEYHEKNDLIEYKGK